MSDLVAIKNLARECSNIAKANGFDVTSEKNLPAKLMFTIDELLREALDALKAEDEKEQNLDEELADGLIRLLACVHDLYGYDWSVRTVSRKVPRFVTKPYEVNISETLRYVCLASECWRHAKSADVKYSLEVAICELQYCARTYGIDLLECAKAKCEKNKKRGHLHGKKHSLG
jgi:NTP pyrophosphatase (non-canonical NTP hydrolase)